MRLETMPELSEPELTVLRQALASAQVELDPPHAASAWRKAAVQEAVDRRPVVARYARSPRSTRGATRA